MAKDDVYDWVAVRTFYESGRSVEECRERFGFSSGAWYHAIERGAIVPRTEASRRPRGSTRREVQRLASLGLTQAQIASELGVSRPTVCFHIRRLGLPAKEELSRRFDWPAIRLYYEAGSSFRACQEHFGFSRAAWAHAVRRGEIAPRPRLEPIEQILVAGRRRSRSHVKTRLLLAGLKEPQCEDCGLGEWRGGSLPLELHHVNGDGHDNRLENLRLLCPNCHSQTENWGGRSKRGG